MPTSRCYFLWPVLIFGKSTRKTVLLCLFWTIFGLFWTYYLVLIFGGEKLVGANFYAFCNYEGKGKVVQIHEIRGLDFGCFGNICLLNKHCSVFNYTINNI